MTIILAVEAGDPAVANSLVGSLTMSRVWARISDEAGTTTEAYVNFIYHVMDTYDAVADPALRRTIIHNNLTSHMLPEVYKAVRLRSHCVVYRQPYQPQDDPVEFAINQVYSRLEKHWSEVSDLHTMRAVIKHIINNDISNMEEAFMYCGYIRNFFRHNSPVGTTGCNHLFRGVTIILFPQVFPGMENSKITVTNHDGTHW